ncbi:MAG: hypothetical protein WC700_17355 [Gemmatimonadaceae bacterium]|jgi:hypothetical protein
MARTTVKQVLTRANINDVGDVLVKCDLGNILDGGNIVAAEALSVSVAHVHTLVNPELWPIAVKVTTAGAMIGLGNYKVAVGIAQGDLATTQCLWTPGSGSTPGTIKFKAGDAVTAGTVCYEKKPANINSNLPA